MKIGTCFCNGCGNRPGPWHEIDCPAWMRNEGFGCHVRLMEAVRSYVREQIKETDTLLARSLKNARAAVQRDKDGL